MHDKNDSATVPITRSSDWPFFTNARKIGQWPNVISNSAQVPLDRTSSKWQLCLSENVH